MASTASPSIERSRTGDPRYILTPEQQALLFRVLQSNSATNLDSIIPPASNSVSNHKTSPVENLQANNASLLDYDYDFEGLGDQSLDFTYPTQSHATGPILGTSSDGDAENHEKRSHPDDEDDDEDGGGKRREGDDKHPKKSGRKILTNEPTSKRKAQNRAAQRAFRDRKEKHLKDLETKVEDLQKASESANHENALLRAKMEKMEAELKAYKQKTTSSGSISASTAVYPTGLFNNPSDINFNFDFPQFGNSDSTIKSSNFPNTTIDQTHPVLKRNASSGNSVSPFEQLMHGNSQYGTFNDSFFTNNMGIIHDFDNNMSTFGLIDQNISNPTMSSATSQSFGDKPPLPHSASGSSVSRSNSASTRQQSTGNSTIYSSPSESDNSAANDGPSSSCGTSPDAHINSPVNKVNTQLHAIDEGSNNDNQYLGHFTSGTGFTPNPELNSFDWSLQTNANTSFDPQLYGDYREPQNAILAGQGLYDGSFFNEAIDLNPFGSPLALSTTPQPSKKDLVTLIDEKLNDSDDAPPVSGQPMTCNNIWERLSNCPSVQNGDIDMDDLCSQLTQKAKCSGNGPVIDEKDFKEVIRGLFPKDKKYSGPC